MKPELAVLALSFLIVGSGTVFATTAGYVCEDKTQIVAIFSPPDAASGSVDLTLDGAAQPIVLPQVLSADGGRYADDAMEFWVKGRDATLTRDGKIQTCHGQ